MLRRVTNAASSPRRNPGLASKQQQQQQQQQPPPPPRRRLLFGSNRAGGNSHRKLSVDTVVVTLLGAAALILIVTYLLPQQSPSTTGVQPPPHNRLGEQQDTDESHLASQRLHERHQVQPPVPVHEHPDLRDHHPGEDEHADITTTTTGTSWVEGERKLKRALRELAARQARGLDIGVPVLTRWVGDDVPAWPHGEMADTATWKAAVEARYAAMRRDEEAWRTRMTEYLQRQPERG